MLLGEISISKNINHYSSLSKSMSENMNKYSVLNILITSSITIICIKKSPNNKR